MAVLSNEQKAIFTRLRRTRAKNRCEYCGASNGALEWPGGRMVKIILTLVHLDLNQANNTDGNLAILCQTCAEKTENDEQKRRDKAQGGAVQEKLL
jgi:hypothetical protein